jgi:predicted MFS family arabinose efflux permease
MVPVANRILIDLGPLRERRGFRLLFAGQLVGVFGTEFTAVAIPFQVYGLTRSSLQVGLVSLAQLIPLIAGALIGGAVGDAVDRRRILLVTSLLLALTSTALAVNAASPRPSLVVLYLVSAAAAGLGGVLSTASYAAVPALVGRGQLVAAYASVQVVDQVGLVAGPALAGLLIAAVHLAWVYALAAGVYLLTTVTVLPIPAIPPVRGADRPGLGSIVAGFRYLRGRQVLRGVYLIDLNAMVFGMPRALFPALAASVFRGGASTLGFLYAAPAAGALVGALTTGWLERIRRQAWAVIAAVCVWGAAIVAFGVVHLLWAALALLAVAGWADVISAVLRSAILQTSVPEAFRSRISSVQIAVVEGGPRLGDLESGAVASLVSTEFAIISGGLACIVGAILLASRLPGFRHYDRCAPAPTGAVAPAAAAEADHDLAPEG